ncbi:MAG: hypothetical protein AB7M05_17735 [Alphaproteobacteria bacterium]
MPEPNRPSRIVTICVGGIRPRKPSENDRRIRILNQAIEAVVASNWHPLDAVVFPGGFFRIRGPFANLEFGRRAAAIEATEAGKALKRGVLRLQTASARALLVTGMDAACLGLGEREDQLCVAFGEAGVTGLARKIILTNRDGQGRRPLVPAVADYESKQRFVVLPNGGKAVLCACYDVFGFDVAPDVSGAKVRAIRAIRTGRGIIKKGEPGFSTLRAACLRNWDRLWREERPAVAISSAHGFDRPGLDGYWQRHGVAACSAALGGKLVVTAAHFYDYLPPEGVSPLAAHRIGQRYLSQGHRRRARPFFPSAEIELVYGGYVQAVARLYAP